MRRHPVHFIIGFAALAFAAVTPLAAQHAEHAAPAHSFEKRADGARVEVLAGSPGDAAIEHIRQHLQALVLTASMGGADTPLAQHVQCMAAGAALLAHKAAIEYVYADLPRGGEVQLVSRDAEAVKAIHGFLEFVQQHHGAAARHHAGGAHGSHGAAHSGLPHGAAHSGLPHGAAHSGLLPACRHGDGHHRP